jgi:hypothetical protein
MSRAALVHAGLLYIVVVQPLLLVMFIRAVIKAPAGPADSPSRPVPSPPEASVAAPASPTPALPQRQPRPEPRAAWPAADTASQPGDEGYVGRHATRSRPPWGPAPKPPGIDREEPW